jgi:hypothetical protein
VREGGGEVGEEGRVREPSVYW